MIFIGYAGIGKTSLAARNVNFIDLDSSNFWYMDKGELIRDEHWYLPYCNIAESLSAQGYDVFVSSHKLVAERLAISNQKVVGIYPIEQLKDSWIEKLKYRAEESNLDADIRALERVQSHFTEDVAEIKNNTLDHIEIQTVRYNLDLLIHNYQRRIGSARKEALYDERGVARYTRV